MDLVCSSDYASLRAAGFDFYFGYEVEDEAGEWCFRASFPDGRKVTIPRSEIEQAGLDHRETPEKVLLGGIGLLCARGLLSAP